MDGAEVGSNKACSSPKTSGMLVLFEATTAAPQRMASSTGNPNPSCNEGKTNARQAL